MDDFLGIMINNSILLTMRSLAYAALSDELSEKRRHVFQEGNEKDSAANEEDVRKCEELL